MKLSSPLWMCCLHKLRSVFFRGTNGDEVPQSITGYVHIYTALVFFSSANIYNNAGLSHPTWASLERHFKQAQLTLNQGVRKLPDV